MTHHWSFGGDGDGDMTPPPGRDAFQGKRKVGRGLNGVEGGQTTEQTGPRRVVEVAVDSATISYPPF